MYYYYYYYNHYHLFTGFSWYFSSWTSGEPHHSGFKFLIVALSCSDVSCRECIECFPDVVFRYFFSPLVTIPVAPKITGMTKHPHSLNFWLKFLYFNLFSDSFCIPIRWYCYIISKQILSFMFLIIMSGLFARNSLSVYISWFHITVISSCWHTGLGMWEYQFFCCFNA
jgi:hypothetical protein